MIQEISSEIKKVLSNFTKEDALILNNSTYPIKENNFLQILPSNQKITFIDGGNAEILSSGNFCLSFIRIAAVTFPEKSIEKHEFYLFTKAEWKNDDLYYSSKIFPLTEKLVDEEDLYISSNDNSIKTGNERASITKIASMARRFAEIKLASKYSTVLLDGILESTYKNEEKYLAQLTNLAGALAKSSSLFTTSGNSPVVLLNKLGPENCWKYKINDKTSFVKLHSQAKHVFRFEGNEEILPSLINNSNDALFLGYPYGLILVDRIARVSNQEKKSLMMKFLLNKENKEISEYLRTADAHSILDNLG
ncbi:MAG: hypothetical protein Q8Q01_05365 [archaeon]|nr:hypothetical protein [archaeon]